MCESAIPFGLLFAENEITLAEQPVATYDEDQDVSVVEENGERVPLVSVADPRMSTETVTEAAGEPTDRRSQACIPHWGLSTDTETKAQDDLTLGGLEPRLVMALATETETRIAGEETD
ncbi:MAG TPA: hypothetical protein VM537_05530 [Anaerolineae bacterium]|nr:hypothetical protein [Anaerolineae bacterium]HUW94950.1 hypothetical protein [Anaerolineae bacterium]